MYNVYQRSYKAIKGENVSFESFISRIIIRYFRISKKAQTWHNNGKKIIELSVELKSKNHEG